MVPDLPAALRDHREELAGRFMIVRKAKRIDFECVVRGYLAGSAWKEYEESHTLAGEEMPPGLRQSEKLAYPIFSPATKAETGHDENITFAQLKKELGDDLATKLRDASLELYKYASEHAERRGIILADTKFEFGLIDDELILIDEVLTPDSSRFWDAATYQVGTSPESYDKQFVRDWLTRSGWDKESRAAGAPARHRRADARALPDRLPAAGRQAAVPAQAEEREVIARVVVTPKPVVNDPQGVTVQAGPGVAWASARSRTCGSASTSRCSLRRRQRARGARARRGDVPPAARQPRDRGLPLRHRARAREA